MALHQAKDLDAWVGSFYIIFRCRSCLVLSKRARCWTDEFSCT